MLLIVPLATLIVASYIYRAELGARALIIYGLLWSAALAVVFALSLSPGIFAAIQCVLAIAILIQVRANPRI